MVVSLLLRGSLVLLRRVLLVLLLGCGIECDIGCGVHRVSCWVCYLCKLPLSRGFEPSSGCLPVPIFPLSAEHFSHFLDLITIAPPQLPCRSDK